MFKVWNFGSIGSLGELWVNLEGDRRGHFQVDRSRFKLTVRQPRCIFKHVGTNTNAEQRQRQFMLGCAPAQMLGEEIVYVELREEVRAKDESARKFVDYEVKVAREKVPTGIELLELPRDLGKFMRRHPLAIISVTAPK